MNVNIGIFSLSIYNNQQNMLIANFREACHAAVHGVAKSWTRLSDWTELIAGLNILHSIYCNLNKNNTDLVLKM